MLSFHKALGGPWASNFTGWVFLFFPSTVLVFLLNANDPNLTTTDILLLAVAQHLAAGVFFLGLAAIIRKRYRYFPLAISFLLWIIIGVTRGVVETWFFETTTTTNTTGGWRILFWVVVAVLWMPLFVFTGAQWDQRIALASTRARLEVLRDEERAHSIEPAETVHKRLVSAVRDHIDPVLEEIRRSLISVSTGIDPAAMRHIGEQLAEVASDAAAIVSGSPPHHLQHDTTAPLRNTNPLTFAVAFERKQAFLGAVVTGLMLLTITLPVGISGQGDLGVVFALAATFVTMGSLILRALVHRIIVPKNHKLRGLVVLAAYATAGVFGSITVLALDSRASTSHNWILVLVFPVATVFVASLISVAVGLSQTNDGLELDIAELEHEIHDLELIALVTEERVRSDLTTLMHGPVQGRLAACVMALNFHASELERGVPERVESITLAVVEHLQAASAELDSLGKTVLTQAQP